MGFLLDLPPVQTVTVSDSDSAWSGRSPSGESWILNRWWPLLFFPLHGDYRIRKKVCALGPNLQQLILKTNRSSTDYLLSYYVLLLLLYYIVIMFCLNPHRPLLVLAGRCWLLNLLMDGSTMCNILSVCWCCLNIQPHPPSWWSVWPVTSELRRSVSVLCTRNLIYL